MTPLLVSLTVQHGVKTDRGQISERLLQAHLVLVPDQGSEFADLGHVQLHIEAQPRNLPAMTPDQTADWLRTMLKALL